ncbi:hypothetical protein NON20_24240 (plasmid) [Synechocystis sp. B12]|nr:hypothetical protein NON20_24240 [Synechocystis sp. B12]
MLINQGIGRGTGTGFGRLSKTIPETQWNITLKGMKPAYCLHKTEQGNITQQGQYRWSPQVLKANLRGLFHRLSLSQLSKVDAQRLTDIIFGSLKKPALLKLTSYLYDDNFSDKSKANPSNQRNQGRNIKYNNIPQSVVNVTWLIKADCNPEFQTLIGQLLALASRIGGLGPGWRRPPHEIRNNCYRGSQFTVTGLGQDENQKVIVVYQAAVATVRQLAQRHQLTLISPNPLPQGCIQSIWQGDPNQWNDIVHKICSTDAANRNGQDRPQWCGTSEDRPSGYAVREYDDKSLITVFDPAVEATLRAKEFTRIWPT